MTTLEQKLQATLGGQGLTIIKLETVVEELQAQLKQISTDHGEVVTKLENKLLVALAENYDPNEEEVE